MKEYPTELKEVLDHIDQHAEEYLETLRNLCRQPSISAQRIGIEETCEMVMKMMSDIDVKKVPTAGAPVIYGNLSGKSEKILSFYNHYDVQPPEPLELWDSDPFAAEVRDGRLYARGAADNKGNLVARLCAVNSYLKVHGELPLNLKFVFEGEEEVGSANLPEFVKENRKLLGSDGCIWESGSKDPRERPTIYLGMKGICYVELEVETATSDLHSSWGTVVPNAAWRLTWALNTLKDENEHIQIPGFYNDVEEPSETEMTILQNMNFDEAGYLKQFGLKSYLGNLTEMDFLKKHIFQPTCTICGILSGYTGEGTKTVLPNKATAKIDFRLVPNQRPEKIVKLLRSHLDSKGFEDVKITSVSGENPAKTPPDSELAKTVIDSARRLYQKEPLVYPIIPGTGPMYVLCQGLGIPAASVGVAHADSRGHAPNENIRISDFIEGIKLIALIMHEFAKPPR